MTGISLQRDLNVALLGGVPQGVIEQVGEDLGHPVGVGVKGERRVRRHLQLERYLLFSGPVFEAGDRLANEFHQVGGLRVEGQATGFRQRKGAQVVHQAGKEFGLTVQALRFLRVERGEAVD